MKLKERFQKIANSKSKAFLMLCFCFLTALIFFTAFDFGRSLLFTFYVLAFVPLFLLIFFWNKKCVRLVLLGGLVFILGGIRVFLSSPLIDKNHIAYYNGQSKEFTAVVAGEPDARMSYVNYTLAAVDGPEGKVLLKSRLYPRYEYGDVLKVNCLLKDVENFDDKFHYDKYLALDDVYSICSYASVKKIGGNQGNFFLSAIFKAKRKIADRVEGLWPEPRAGFMAGLLYGDRAGLSDELTENFNRAGITHIIAISGYNISLIVTLMMGLLIFSGLYRQQAFWFVLFGVFIFTIFAGASASVVRAAVMGGLVLLSKYLGRASSVGNIIVFAVVLMASVNPLILLYDAGFQLSLLATLGLVYLYPLLDKKFFEKFSFLNHYGFLKETILATLSATILTLPLILYGFERLSLVSLPVNLLVLWIIPWLMLGGFCATALSFIFYPLGKIIAWLSGEGLDYIIKIAEVFGKPSWSSLPLTIPLWLLVVLYLFMFVVILNARGILKKEFEN